MITYDEDAFICDFAETYHIYDYRSLPANLVATYAAGLRESSRIKTKMNGMERPFNEYIMAAIYDGINWLCWTKTEDGIKGRNRPGRIMDLFLDKKESDATGNDYQVYGSPEDFENAWARLAGE